MKKLLFVAFIMVCSAVMAQSTFVTNKTVTASGTYPFFTNRVHVTAVSLVSANNNTLVEFFNAITNAPYSGTNYVVTSYVSRATAQSNIVTTFVQPDTGFTNWYTNAGLFTYMVTNAAATNALAPVGALVGGAQPVLYPVDWLCENGLTVRTSTNATMVLYYNLGK